MSNEVSNGEIYGVLLVLNEKVGSLTAKIDSHHAWMGKHVEDDRRMGEDIHAIQMAQSKQRGSTKTWGLVATSVGGILGTVAGAAASLIKWH